MLNFTMTQTHLTQTPFSAFSLPESLKQGIDEAGFSHCTPIQAKSLPLALSYADIAAQSQTGTGKTAAFLIALMDYLLKVPPLKQRTAQQPRALVLAPTRELAIQIHKDALQLGKHTGLRMGLIYGGSSYDKQRTALQEGIDVLIGTPGRIIDLFKQSVLGLQAIQVLVIDEADRMFDLGFIRDLRYLLRRMPPPEKRLSMLFSATLSLRVTELAYEHMNNPRLIKSGAATIVADNIEESIYFPASDEKIPLLIGLLQHIKPKRALVFVNTKHAAERVTRYLQANHIDAGVLSGDIPQNKRQSVLKQFQQGNLPIIVATDVAARGLHIPNVSHVINYDLPQDGESYVHRIGRTARAGLRGTAISFGCEDYVYSLTEIEEFIGHKIPALALDTGLLAVPEKPHGPPARAGGRPRRGGPPGGKRPKGAGRRHKHP
jgi:ATP-dependent RNA helicase RhlB